MNVSDDESIKSVFKEVSKKVDHVDYLINNAGLNKDSATNGKKELVCNLNALDRESLLKMFNVNSISPMMVIKFFLPLLHSTPSFVINITSARSSYKDEYPNTNGNYGYRASKAALNMMTFSSLFDLPKNVKTFVVHPGGVKTDMNPTGEHDPIEQAKKLSTYQKIGEKNSMVGSLDSTELFIRYKKLIFISGGRSAAWNEDCIKSEHQVC